MVIEWSLPRVREASSRRSAPSATSRSVVYQNGGSERAQEVAVPRRLEPRSRARRRRRGRSIDRISRPTPCASRTAASGTLTRRSRSRRPRRPPARAAPAARPAAGTGSGRSRRAGRRRPARRRPATATAAEQAGRRVGREPRDQLGSASSPCSRIGEVGPLAQHLGGLLGRPARREQAERATARPPATSVGQLVRRRGRRRRRGPGGGRCAATYRMPWRA